MKIDVTPEDVARYVVEGLARDMKKDITCPRNTVFPLISSSAWGGTEFRGFRATINTIKHDKQSDPVTV